MIAETPPLPRYEVRRTARACPDWDVAVPLAAFTFPWEPTPPPLTDFRALWDGETLFFRFECQDHDLVLGDEDAVKARVLDSDRVEIFFTPDLSLCPYYAFEMTPRGETLAYSARFYREYDWGWSCPELKVIASIGGGCYQVEGRLPLEKLRALGVLKPGAGQFYAGVFRAEFSRLPDGGIRRGWMPWVNPRTERPDFHVPAAFGVFELAG